MLTKTVLSPASAREIIDKALKLAEDAGHDVSVAVVDDGGYLIAMQKTLGAGKLTAKVAIEKARTAALLRAPSGALQDRLQDDPALLRLTDYLPMAGGFPVMLDGQCAGAVGVSGGTADQDCAVGEASLAVLKGLE